MYIVEFSWYKSINRQSANWRIWCLRHVCGINIQVPPLLGKVLPVILKLLTSDQMINGMSYEDAYIRTSSSMLTGGGGAQTPRWRRQSPQWSSNGATWGRGARATLYLLCVAKEFTNYDCNDINVSVGLRRAPPVVARHVCSRGLGLDRCSPVWCCHHRRSKGAVNRANESSTFCSDF